MAKGADEGKCEVLRAALRGQVWSEGYYVCLRTQDVYTARDQTRICLYYI